MEVYHEPSIENDNSEDLSIECKDIPRTQKLTNVLEMKCFLENLLIICGKTDRYIFQNFLGQCIWKKHIQVEPCLLLMYIGFLQIISRSEIAKRNITKHKTGG